MERRCRFPDWKIGREEGGKENRNEEEKTQIYVHSFRSLGFVPESRRCV